MNYSRLRVNSRFSNAGETGEHRDNNTNFFRGHFNIFFFYLLIVISIIVLYVYFFTSRKQTQFYSLSLFFELEFLLSLALDTYQSATEAHPPATLIFKRASSIDCHRAHALTHSLSYALAHWVAAAAAPKHMFSF